VLYIGTDSPPTPPRYAAPISAATILTPYFTLLGTIGFCGGCACALGALAASAEANERSERGVPLDVSDVSGDHGCA